MTDGSQEVSRMQRELLDWARIYLKHHDLLKREIKEIVEDEEGTGLILKKSSGVEHWRVADKLSAANLDAAGLKGIVCGNTRENLDLLLAHWKEFVAKEGLKLIFANPRVNERWLLVPSHHDRISDDESLKPGLESLFSNVLEY